jgi:NAD+ synthase
MKNKIVLKNVSDTIDDIIRDIRDYFSEPENRGTKAIIGMSGGKDSTIAAALLVRALGPENVVGVLMPNGHQSDFDDAMEVCESILELRNIEVIDIGPITDSFYNAIGYEWCETDAIRTNTPARMRMAMLYALASIYHARVICTSNASEKYVGYTTKYGDNVGDYAIWKNFYVRDILAIGEVLEELPNEFVFKAPADGMSGSTDEERLGFSYDELDSYILNGEIKYVESVSKIKARHLSAEHKRNVNMPGPDRPWRYFVEENIAPLNFDDNTSITLL